VFKSVLVTERSASLGALATTRLADGRASRVALWMAPPPRRIWSVCAGQKTCRGALAPQREGEGSVRLHELHR
jgi:hypothetical protein